MASNSIVTLVAAYVEIFVIKEKTSIGRLGQYSLTVSPNQGVSQTFNSTDVIRGNTMTKKVYAQPNLTAYGSVQKLTKGSGAINLGDSVIFTNLPNGANDLEIESIGSNDVTVDFEELFD